MNCTIDFQLISLDFAIEFANLQCGYRRMDVWMDRQMDRIMDRQTEQWADRPMNR